MTIRKPTHIQELKDLQALFEEGVDVTRITTLSEHETERQQLLQRDEMCILVAVDNDQVVGGLVAYELPFISGEKEMYLYDIAVAEVFQRKGIGTQLIDALKREALERGVRTIFVDAEADDEGAIAFYRSLSAKEIAVNHFIITT